MIILCHIQPVMLFLYTDTSVCFSVKNHNSDRHYMEFSTSTSTYIISGLCNILPVVFKLYSGPNIIHDSGEEDLACG
jgi:hypothetical protein